MRIRTAVAAAILLVGLAATTGCSYHYEVKCQAGQGCHSSESHDDSNGTGGYHGNNDYGSSSRGGHR